MGARLPARRKQDWGQLGPAMKALPNDQWRAFAEHYVTEKPGHGALAAAARKAGFGKNSAARKVGIDEDSTPTNLAKIAWRISRDERMIAAIAELSRAIIRVGAPAAVNAIMNVILDPTHKDHVRACDIVLSRADPVETRHKMEVVHKTVDPDQEALEELRALRQLGTPRETLVGLFGHNGLDRIEALERADTVRRADNAKVIEGEVIERDMANG
jgi:hypothetical protein